MKHRSVPALSQNKYENPLQIDFSKTNLSEWNAYSNADPFVIKYNGEYYCYPSGTDFLSVLHSKDLVHFEHQGKIFEEEGAYSYWAPCVFYDNGTFYLYYSSNPLGEKDDHYHFLKVASSKSPLGPFRFEKQLRTVFSIDPHVVRDTDGQMYLFYSVNDLTGVDRHHAGTSIVVDRLIDPLTPEGDPKPVIIPSLEEEVFAHDRFGDGRNWHTVEGAMYFEKHGNAYVMYSGNAFLRPNYFVGYSSASKNGNINALKWTKHPNDHDYQPLISKSDQVMDTGHNSVVRAPNNMDEWIVYHGRDIHLTEEDPWYRNRIMRIDPLYFGQGKLLTIAPTQCEQDAPAMPYHRDLFDGDLTAYCAAGEWTVEQSCAIQHQRNSIAELVLQKAPLCAYHMEVWLKWRRFHMGGRYGVYAAYENAVNNVQVLFDVGSRRIELYEVQNGVKSAVSSYQLPVTFLFDEFHRITVERTAGDFAVWVDEMPVLHAVYSNSPAQVGLLCSYTCAVFEALELTDCMTLTDQNQVGFAQLLTTDSISQEINWELGDHALMAWAIDGFRALMKPTDGGYRFSADVELMRDGQETGLYLAYFSAETYWSAELEPEQQRVAFYAVQNGKKERLADAPMPHRSVSLTVRRIGDKLVALADGTPVLTATIPNEAAQCGFMAHRPARFTAIEWIGIC